MAKGRSLVQPLLRTNPARLLDQAMGPVPSLPRAARTPSVTATRSTAPKKTSRPLPAHRSLAQLDPSQHRGRSVPPSERKLTGENGVRGGYGLSVTKTKRTKP
jgi:hypothetical protein